ncbi:MAG: hypothetical protein J0H91_20040, partial [Rhodospirillales bacterium]|nr:hypothetical protein [Rhodospirillales bacterium]
MAATAPADRCCRSSTPRNLRTGEASSGVDAAVSPAMSLGRLFSTAPPPPILRDRAPIRAELFGVERLEDHGRSLAAAQPVRPGRSRGFSLAGRLADNAALLLAANRTIATVAARQGEASPAALWLIDNYHLVDMQIREIGVDLPTGYYLELPKVADGPFAGLPRVFGAAWALVAHTDSHFEPETLRRYLLAYQEVQPLSIGELWAIPTTLRIALIENLRRVAQIIVENAEDCRQADAVADRLSAGRRGQAAEPWPKVHASLGHIQVTDAFAVQLVHRLRGHGPDDPTPAWLVRRLGERGTTIDAAVREVLQTVNRHAKGTPDRRPKGTPSDDRDGSRCSAHRSRRRRWAEQRGRVVVRGAG